MLWVLLDVQNCLDYKVIFTLVSLKVKSDMNKIESFKSKNMPIAIQQLSSVACKVFQGLTSQLIGIKYVQGGIS